MFYVDGVAQVPEFISAQDARSIRSAKLIISLVEDNRDKRKHISLVIVFTATTLLLSVDIVHFTFEGGHYKRPTIQQGILYCRVAS
mmetsp:Transcript_19707/g.34649  ORF Transcript_19707/g.34649 Transcript_19707/m.34649 type:complete len:86 (-) Transcript_19707:1569-1826(-)